jgi:hypothetical protein
MIANLLLLNAFVNAILMPSFKDPMQFLHASSSFNATKLCVSRFDKAMLLPCFFKVWQSLFLQDSME